MTLHRLEFIMIFLSRSCARRQVLGILNNRGTLGRKAVPVMLLSTAMMIVGCRTSGDSQSQGLGSSLKSIYDSEYLLRMHPIAGSAREDSRNGKLVRFEICLPDDSGRVVPGSCVNAFEKAGDSEGELEPLEFSFQQISPRIFGRHQVLVADLEKAWDQYISDQMINDVVVPTALLAIGTSLGVPAANNLFVAPGVSQTNVVTGIFLTIASGVSIIFGVLKLVEGHSGNDEVTGADITSMIPEDAQAYTAQYTVAMHDWSRLSDTTQAHKAQSDSVDTFVRSELIPVIRNHFGAPIITHLCFPQSAGSGQKNCQQVP